MRGTGAQKRQSTQPRQDACHGHSGESNERQRNGGRSNEPRLELSANNAPVEEPHPMSLLRACTRRQSLYRPGRWVALYEGQPHFSPACE